MAIYICCKDTDLLSSTNPKDFDDIIEEVNNMVDEMLKQEEQLKKNCTKHKGILIASKNHPLKIGRIIYEFSSIPSFYAFTKLLMYKAYKLLDNVEINEGDDGACDYILHTKLEAGKRLSVNQKLDHVKYKDLI